jgi:type I restriction enzyme M protein
MSVDNVVQKIWNLCHILRGDGVSYHEYVSELTYLLFLKIAHENGTEYLLPEGHRWSDLVEYQGDNLLTFYREMLTYLGGHAPSEQVRLIYAFPTTVFSHSENLKAVIDGIALLDWHSLTQDGMGEIYEGLLSKSSQDARSGAGQYFTPRPLVDSIVRLTDPRPGEVIQDPASGSGGFLISADHHVRAKATPAAYDAHPPRYEGVEIEKGTFRICLMNAFLHRLDAHIILGDALTADAEQLSPADVILANPPFGAKAGSARKLRSDLPFPTANKQLAFLQHIYLGLKPGGRAAVVLPDNVLFEEGSGRRIRQDLMEKCDLHTILRLPTGIFYSQGVKTNVLFFTRGETDMGNTGAVWIYDMRSGAPRYGRTRPLRLEDFSAFESAYGKGPAGKFERIDEGETGRWRMFSRKVVADRLDNLDLSWLPEDGTSEDDVPSEPDEIAAAVLVRLRSALSDIDAVAEDLAELVGLSR